jgi:hypothetical protein
MADRAAALALERLAAEREHLSGRVDGLDKQLVELLSVRIEELSRRLVALEAAAGGAVVAPAAVPPAPPVPVAPVVPATQGPMPRPLVIGERVSTCTLALYSGPGTAGAVVGWIPPGTRLLLTDGHSDGRSEIAYQDHLAWVDDAGLGPVPAWAPPSVAMAGPAVPARASRTAAPPGIPQPPRPPLPPAGAPGFGPPMAPPMAPPARPLPPPPRVPVAAPVAGPPRVAVPPPWQRPGFMTKVLALAGAAVTLIGVALLLVLAAQYGMFGPEARTISAALLGVVLVSLAFVVRGRDARNVGAPILAATGIAAGFLSVVTATVIYHWLPPLVGAALTAAVGLAGMGLARLWDNQWVALVSVLGSLVLAAYVGANESLATASLMLLMTGVTLAFERGTGWRLFPFARVLPTVLALLGLVVPGMVPAGQLGWLVALTVLLALLGLASALIAPAEPGAGRAIALGLLVPMVLPALLAPQRLADAVLGALALGVVAVAFGVAGFLPVVPERVRWACVPIGAAFTALAGFTATHEQYLGLLTLALATVYLAVAARVRSWVNFVVGGVLGAVGLAGWLPLAAVLVSQRATEGTGPEQVAESLAGIAVVVLATLATIRWTGRTRPRTIYLSWASAILLGSVAVILSGAIIGTAAGGGDAGFQAGQALVTTAWMILCIVCLRRGLAATQDEDVWLHLALAIAALAVAKLFLLDLNMLDAIARVGAFLAVGLLLLFVGTRYARAWERAHGDNDARPGAAGIPAAPPPVQPGPPPPVPAAPPSPPSPPAQPSLALPATRPDGSRPPPEPPVSSGQH